MLLRVFVIVLAAYALIAALVFVFQARLLFVPEFGGRQLEIDPARIGLAFEDLEIETDDGERLHAWWIAHPAARATVLFSHGNAGNISHRLDSVRIFHDLGLNVLIYDYRGYGKSSGKPSESGLYRDGETIWQWLVGPRRVSPDRIVVFGRSLGAAISARLASTHDPACLILESGFTSVPDAAADVYWWLPVRWLARIRLDTQADVRDAKSPVLVVHSRDDEIIPFHHGRRLAEAAGSGARLLAIRGRHNTGFLHSGAAYTDGLKEFLDSCLGP